MNKNLSHSEICRAICLAQKIISNLHEQNNIEIKESYYLKRRLMICKKFLKLSLLSRANRWLIRLSANY